MKKSSQMSDGPQGGKSHSGMKSPEGGAPRGVIRSRDGRSPHEADSPAKNHRKGCVLCGRDLTYLEAEEEMNCALCGVSARANVRCSDGHYICDGCHSLDADDFIERVCASTALTDPLELALNIMRDERIKMHGPEHHFLVPAVLLACYLNAAGGDIGQAGRAAAVSRARTRAEKVPGGFCGTHGSCGAAMGTGIFISIITEATPLSEGEWKLSNRMTAEALQRIARHGGPRCCKRNSFLAILEAGKFLEEHLDVRLPVSGKVRCEFYDLNRECRTVRCPFYAGE
jgi:hypothetical protein